MINLYVPSQRVELAMTFLRKHRKEKPKTSSSNTSAILNVDLEQREMLLLSKCVALSAFSPPLESA